MGISRHPGFGSQRITSQSARTASVSCGANGGKEQPARKAIAGWSGYCHCVTPAHPGSADISRTSRGGGMFLQR